MDDQLISLFIDDELDLEEKITFVETVHRSQPFYEEAISLLHQEKRLQQLPSAVPAFVAVKPSGWRTFFNLQPFRVWLQPLAGFAAAMLLVGLAVVLQSDPEISAAYEKHRFVVYLPQTSQAQLVGSFTGWNPVPMEKIGTSGYWALTLEVPPGEHRYSYLIEDDTQLADPTVIWREYDDFGGENSVLVIGDDDAPVS